MSDDLVVFLRARLDEDEASAKDERVWFGPYPETIKESEGELIIQKERVLAEAKAKRAILAAYEDAAEHPYDLPEGVRDGRDQDERELDAAVLDTLDGAVRTLAAVYSDHPDYRPEWKPQ